MSRWHDQSGNGNDAIQAETVKATAIGRSQLRADKPALRFDGVNDRLGMTGTKPMHQISMFLVFKMDSGATGPHPYYPVCLGGTYSDGHVYGLSMRNDFSGNSPNIIDPWASGSSWLHETLDGIAEFGKWKLLSITTDKTIWNTNLRVGGQKAVPSPQGNDIAINVPLGNSDGSGVGGIGGADNVPENTLIFKGDIAEVIVYDTVLAEADRQRVENYLSSRYNIPLATGKAAAQNGMPFAPLRFALEQNYPNPFNPTTGVRFQVPEVSDVKLVVYDILGREVAVLVNERKSAGTYEARFDASGLSSGVYIYRLTAGMYVQSRKMVLLK